MNKLSSISVSQNLARLITQEGSYDLFLISRPNIARFRRIESGYGVQITLERDFDQATDWIIAGETQIYGLPAPVFKPVLVAGSLPVGREDLLAFYEAIRQSQSARGGSPVLEIDAKLII